MNHLISPTFPSPVPATIPQTIQPVTLSYAAIEIIQPSESQDLLSTDSVLSDLESVISIEEPDESGFIVSKLLAESTINLTVADADKIVETITTKTTDSENKIDESKQLKNNFDNIDNNIEKDTTINVTNIVENIAGKVSEDAVSDSVGVNGSGNGKVKLRSRSTSRQISPRVNRFHRIAAVRVEQGISLSLAAKRLRIDIGEASEQENESTDLKLSQLYAWRDVLEVSMGELVVEPEEIPANPIRNRCQLVRLMKTVRSIIIESKSEVALILARQLESQLIELMPELATIAAWPSLGQSRDPHSPGVAATRCLGFGNVYRRKTNTTKNDNK
jgi:transcriptional regulator with XRE-family HTH domain